MSVVVIGPAVTDVVGIPIPPPEKWQEKQRIESVRMRVGGDAANQSARLSAMGHAVSLVTAVGDDAAGRMILEEMKARGVDTRHTAVHPECPTAISMILVGEDGERNIFSSKGAHVLVGREDCGWIPDAHPAAISLASLFSIPRLEEDGLMELLQSAKERGILTFADLGADKRRQGLDGIRRFLPHLDYFLPSEADALQMTGADSPEGAAEIYLSEGAANVVIKCGHRGAFWHTRDASGWVPAGMVHPIDTTGAGDCMVAHFIDGILRGQGIPAACGAACIAASESTLHIGSMPTI
ncbi:MAG: carbohydrate kinase family protein [Lachnospiraceae bacterium]|nr:carbohydrate kinase family protein [Lachnospiraceae bacterium]